MHQNRLFTSTIGVGVTANFTSLLLLYLIILSAKLSQIEKRQNHQVFEKNFGGNTTKKVHKCLAKKSGIDIFEMRKFLIIVIS